MKLHERMQLSREVVKGAHCLHMLHLLKRNAFFETLGWASDTDDDKLYFDAWETLVCICEKFNIDNRVNLDDWHTAMNKLHDYVKQTVSMKESSYIVSVWFEGEADANR